MQIHPNERPRPPRETLTDYERVMKLLAKISLYCGNPGGRFGEDRCGKCAGCELLAIRRAHGKDDA